MFTQVNDQYVENNALSDSNVETRVQNHCWSDHTSTTEPSDENKSVNDVQMVMNGRLNNDN